MDSAAGDAPKPLGPYSPIVRAGDWLVCSGQLGVSGGKLVEGLGAQVTQALANAQALLQSQGASLDDVVKATVFLADMADFSAMNEAYLAAFGDHRPARSAFAAVALPMDAAVEIEVWAFTGPGKISIVIIGALIIAVVIVFALPIVFLLSGTVGTITLGWLLKENAEAVHPGSELIDTNY